MASLSELVGLVTDPLTCELYDRHADAVARLVADRGSLGIYVSELQYLEELLILLGERVDAEWSAACASSAGVAEASPLAMCLVELLKLCERPFVEEKANAKYRNSELICGVLVATSSLLLSKMNAVKIGAANVLYEFTKKRLPGDPQAVGASGGNTGEWDQRPDEWTYNQHLFQRSGAMAVVADTVRDEVSYLFVNDIDGDGRIDQVEYENAYGAGSVFTVYLMKLVCELAAYEENALSLSREHVPALLVKVVSQLVDFRKEEVKLMLQTLWSVLEHSYARVSNPHSRAGTRMQLLDKFRNANALYGLGNPETLGMLRSLLERMLVEGFKRPDKELRNEVLIISSLLARRAGNLSHFNSTGFLSLVVLYATAAENGLPTGCNDRHYATSDALDMELKVLMWYLVRALAADRTNRAIVGDSLFLQSLLFYLRPAPAPGAGTTGTTGTAGAGAEPGALAMWSPDKLRTLQLNALTVLASMIKLLPDQFFKLGGPAVVVEFLAALQPSVAADGAPADGLAEGPAGNPSIPLVDAALQVVLAMPANAVAEQDRKDLVRIALGLLQVADAHTRSTAALVLATVCAEGAKPLKEFRKRKGISKVCKLLVVDPTNFLYTESGLVACLAVVHSAIATCQKSLLAFLAQDGIEQLLNALENVEHDEVKSQILAVLADLLHNSKGHAKPYVLAWKSYKSGRSAPGLALDMWLDNFAPTIIQDDELGRPIRRRPREQPRLPLCQDLGEQHGQDEGLDEEEEDNGSPAAAGTTAAAGKTGSGGRLQQALRVAKATTIPDLDQRVLEGARGLDVRDRVAAFLQALGFDSVDTNALTRNQRIAFSVAVNYEHFCEGEAWAAVQQRLAAKGVKPVFYDQAFLDKQTHAFQQKARDTQAVQMREEKAKLDDELEQDRVFFNAIREKRDQEVQAKLVNKQVSVMKKRLEQKEKQKAMLKRAADNQLAQP